MDPLSAIASVIAIYELASKVGIVCFRYAKGIKDADNEVGRILAEIDNFRLSLYALKEMLEDEARTMDIDKTTDRLPALRNIMSPRSVLLKDCQSDLESLNGRLQKDSSQRAGRRVQAKVLWHKLT